jgi:hypothetical protein
MEYLPLETSQNVLRHFPKDDLFRVAWTSKRLRLFATTLPDWFFRCQYTVKPGKDIESSGTDLFVKRIEEMRRCGLRLEVALSVDQGLPEIELTDSPWMAVVDTTTGAMSAGSVVVLVASLPSWMMAHWLTQCTTPAPALRELRLQFFLR